MLILLKTTMAGPRGCFSAGAKVVLPTDEALALIAGGFADSLEPAAAPVPEERAIPTETATAEPDAEQAVAVRPKKRKADARWTHEEGKA